MMDNNYFIGVDGEDAINSNNNNSHGIYTDKDVDDVFDNDDDGDDKYSSAASSPLLDTHRPHMSSAPVSPPSRHCRPR